MEVSWENHLLWAIYTIAMLNNQRVPVTTHKNGGF